MSQSKIKKALGLVKDRTSIGLAKVGMATITTDLEVAIVKATRHSSSPPDERHIREIITLTSYSRFHVGSAVSAIAKRIGKTRNWTVALKCLILVHRLLAEGDPSYEQEFTYATRRGTRLLNLSDFRDVSHSDSWDFSAFVRTYALYLDQRLESRMKARDDSLPPKPFRELGTDKVFARIQSLQHILERFLATRPTGYAKQSRLIIISLYPVVQESFAVYNEITEMMSILIDRFTNLEVPQCVNVYETFSRVGKRLDELDSYYDWSKSVGIARSFEYPVIERVTPRKLQIMDDFICDKSASFARRAQKIAEQETQSVLEIKALPAPGDDQEKKFAEEEEKIADEQAEVREETVLPEAPKMEKVPDLLDLTGDFTAEENGDRLALALFSGEASSAPAAPLAEAINSAADWELALVESTSNLAAKKAELGGGFDVLMLDGLYDGHLANAASGQAASAGSASSMVMIPPQPGLLALPAPPSGDGSSSGTGIGSISSDPFAASTMVAPPPYVQMSDMEKKQVFMVQEQQMWNQYAKDGMQGQLALTQLQYNPYSTPGLVPGSYMGVQPSLYGGYMQS
ncbi:putative clathrin assembly protein At1g03050 [Nymphaea colorata]|nr:putative clathrin assembly protein At1g03050 [Nymphaea colorata]